MAKNLKGEIFVRVKASEWWDKEESRKYQKETNGKLRAELVEAQRDMMDRAEVAYQAGKREGGNDLIARIKLIEDRDQTRNARIGHIQDELQGSVERLDSRLEVIEKRSEINRHNAENVAGRTTYLETRVAESETKFEKFIQAYNSEVQRDNEWGETVRACTDSLAARVKLIEERERIRKDIAEILGRRVSALESIWNDIGPKLDTHYAEVKAALAELEAAASVCDDCPVDATVQGTEANAAKVTLDPAPEWPAVVPRHRTAGGNEWWEVEGADCFLTRSQAEAYARLIQAGIELARRDDDRHVQTITGSQARRILRGEGR
jgi:hypothetical protein